MPFSSFGGQTYYESATAQVPLRAESDPLDSFGSAG
jgi:hypothetical protein